MKKDTIEQLAKEEKELEAQMISAPTGDSTKKPEATETPGGADDALAKDKGLVTPDPKPATDEHKETKIAEDWEKRYKNLRSSRDVKLYETKSQLSAALTAVNALQSQVDELKKVKPTVDPLEGVFTDADTEALGDATVDAMRRVTKAATDAATKPLQDELDRERKLRTEQNKTNAQQSKQDAYNIFMSRVAQAVPDWKEINYDKDFEDYLNKPDVDGTIRKTYFQRAEAQGQAAQIIRFMSDFKKAKAKKPKDKLADKVTPTGEDAGATQAKENHKAETISRRFIEKFYDDLNRGRYKGRESEALAIEAKIDRATMERRIVA